MKSALMVLRHRPHAPARVLCVPYAGAGASVYRAWLNLLRDDVEVVAVQLPGRENRFSETALTNIQHIIESLLPPVRAMLDRPLVMFGHSLGAQIGVELAYHLEKLGEPAPVRLIASGMTCPLVPLRDEPIHLLEDGPFLDRIRRFNGTPAELLDDEDLMSLCIPTLRADFNIAHSYRYPDDRPRIRCPVTVLGGDRDDTVPTQDLQAWTEITESPVDIHVFPGDHFFIHAHPSRVVSVIHSKIQDCLRAAA
jgi:medium-chain acyl-[acyl-carrier-protein] hydrolase